MIKFWRVCLYEYLRHVLRKRFIFILLSPVLMLAAGLVFGLLAIFVQYDHTPAGYVDQSGWLAHPIVTSESTSWLFSLHLQAYPSETAARAALDAKQIQAYYVIGSDYLQSGKIRLVAPEPVGENVDGAMRSFLRANLIANQPPDVVQRLTDGDRIDVRTLDGSRRMSSSQWWKMIIPLVAGVMLILVINMSGGYLLQAVVEEKENRTMEIVVTSVSPEQLMVGKIVGSLSVGVTQVLIWTIVPFIGLLAARDIIPQLRAVTLDPIFVLVMLLTLVPAFVLIAALMAMVGATTTEGREAQQMAGLFTLPLAVPLWLVTPLVTNPNGALSIGLSLFPLTAPVSLPLRVGYANVPYWQIGLSIGLLFASAALALWLAGRAFRLGMLRYGKPISWKELFVVRRVGKGQG